MFVILIGNVRYDFVDEELFINVVMLIGCVELILIIGKGIFMVLNFFFKLICFVSFGVR